jgi:hypothetical protein
MIMNACRSVRESGMSGLEARPELL